MNKWLLGPVLVLLQKIFEQLVLLNQKQDKIIDLLTPKDIAEFKVSVDKPSEQ